MVEQNLGKDVAQDRGNASPPSDENLWTFGQYAAVILLMLPILSIGENNFEAKPAKGQSPPQVPRKTENSPLAVGENEAQPVDSQRAGTMVPLGLWSLEAPTDTDSHQKGAGNQQNISRTATYLQIFEQNVDGNVEPRSQSLNGEIQAEHKEKFEPLPTLESSNPRHDSTSAVNKVAPHLQDPYRFEWFRLLVILIFSFTSLDMVLLLLISNFTMDLERLGVIMRFILYEVLAIVVWTASNTFAQMYRKPVETSATQLKIEVKSSRPRTWLRVLWYLWYLCTAISAGFGVTYEMWEYCRTSNRC
ncbi:MAG: hypothetical protein Q9164_001769 [Protoblastenia rupestris]